MKPKKIWILVGDGARARILETEKLSKELDPVFDYDFVLPQRSSRDIGTDRPASRGGAVGSERHGVAPRVDWHE